MAVQLARLSLWLATLAADKPLSFLDHHLVAGNSLVGASPDDLRRQPGGGAARGRRHEELPLFPDGQPVDLSSSTRFSVRLRLTLEPDDSAAIVREKERTLAALHGKGSSLGHVVAAARPVVRRLVLEQRRTRPTGPRFASSPRGCSTSRCALPERTVFAAAESRADATAERSPVSSLAAGVPGSVPRRAGPSEASAGVRRRHRQPAVGHGPRRQRRRATYGRRGRRTRGGSPTSSASPASIASRARAHVNLYQLFVERALQLVRRGGRIGLVLPSGIVSDAGAAPLRRHLFDRADVDAITGLDNRDGIFPIHRSVRFVLLTCTAGRPTQRDPLPVRDHARSRICDRGDDGRRRPITLTRAFITAAVRRRRPRHPRARHARATSPSSSASAPGAAARRSRRAGACSSAAS